jgi:acetone monooxygenase
MASGGLTIPYVPHFPGLSSFKGKVLIPARWPREGVDLKGKKVILIGNGPSGVQIRPAFAKDVKKVTLLQRSGNYVANTRRSKLQDTSFPPR